MSASLSRLDTKQRILDSAEVLFAEQGVAATSLRAIIAGAGVNAAAIHYHFGSKEALIEALFSRRIEPLNRERLMRLDALESAAGDAPIDLEDLLHAFMEPMISMGAQLGERGRVVAGVIGRLLSEEPESFRKLAEQHIRVVRSRYTEALARSAGSLSLEEAGERLEYVMGALVHSFARRALTTDESPDLADVQSRMGRLIRFLAAGVQLPADPNLKAPEKRLSA